MSKQVLIGITAALCLSFTVGCGEKKKEAPAAGGGGQAPATASAGGEVKLDPATAGTIKGKVIDTYTIKH